MRVRIETTNDTAAAQVRRMLRFTLSAMADEVKSVRVVVDDVRDPLGAKLNRCRAELNPWQGEPIAVEEVQSGLELAVSRALERTLRTVRRRRRSTNSGGVALLTAQGSPVGRDV